VNIELVMKYKITPLKAAIIFISSLAYFYLLLFTVLPFLEHSFTLNPALYWFITGYFLFIPLFIYAVKKVRDEGNSSVKQIMTALSIKAFSKKDWAYAICGLALVFLFTGLIFSGSIFLSKYMGCKPLNTQPWFMEVHPFKGAERFLLLVWAPMFFFNIVGEEILWRGYIQQRLDGKYAWLMCSLLWSTFHIPFGADLLITLIPALIIIPYAYHKTHNTLVGIFIHGVYNGPIFVAVALGWIR